MRLITRVMATIVMLAFSLPVKAFSLNLDSIAAKGKFPRFCVKIYREGDRIFNSYDSVYVRPTGFPFKVSANSESWLTYYSFHFPEKVRMDFYSIPSTSVGLHLSWLAISIGYEKNVSSLLGLKSEGRQRWKFGISSSRLVADFYFIKSDGGLKMNRFGTKQFSDNPGMYFNGGDTKQWQLLTLYFFNHLRYSYSAAFGYGKLQRKTAGSWFAGIAASWQYYYFDFSCLPDEILEHLPIKEQDFIYSVNTHLWGITGGYAANICLGRGWLLGFTEAPVLGVRYGHDSTSRRRARFGLSNTLNGSLIYNHPGNRLYLGGTGSIHTNIISDHVHTLGNLLVSMTLSVGYRF